MTRIGRFIFWINRFALLSWAASLILFIALLFNKQLLGFGNRLIFYPLASFTSEGIISVFIVGLLNFLLMPLFLLGVYAILFIAHWLTQKKDWLAFKQDGKWAKRVFLLAIILMFMSLIEPRGNPQSVGFQESPPVSLNQHVYRAVLFRHLLDFAGRAYVFKFGHDLFLYECDSLSLICNQIYRLPIPWKEDMGSNVTAEIVIPPSTSNTIALLVNGEVVYTHPVEPDS